SYGGRMSYAPGLALVMTFFLFSLAGLPPLGGWFAKFYVFLAVLRAGTPSAVVLGVITAVNSVIALFYYAGVAREMWMSPVPDGDRTKIVVPAPLTAALAISASVVVAIGVYPQLFARLAALGTLPK